MALTRLREGVKCRSSKFLLVLVRTVFLGYWSRGTHDHIFRSHGSSSRATVQSGANS
jgi:hypothetical protein